MSDYMAVECALDEIEHRIGNEFPEVTDETLVTIREMLREPVRLAFTEARMSVAP